MSTEMFKFQLKRGLENLLPYAKANIIRPDQLEKEIREFNGFRPERIYEFPPYRLILSFDEYKDSEVIMSSVSAPMRSDGRQVLTDDEKKAFYEAFCEAFPDYMAGQIGSILPGATAYKVYGIHKDASAEVKKLGSW